MATQGLQREGFKASEVFQIVKIWKSLVDDGETEDVAYAIAVRGSQDKPIVGVSADTIKGWKPDIIKLAKGEDTPALSLLSGSASPGVTTPKNDEMVKRFTKLGERLDLVEGDYKRIQKESAEKDAELARLRSENAAFKSTALGEAPPPAGEVSAAKPVKK